MQDPSLSTAAIEAKGQSMSEKEVKAAAREGRAYLTGLAVRGTQFK
jgi:hypothetical protein